MNVLVDTSIWSLALRRSPIHEIPAEQRQQIQLLEELILAGRARLLGLVRQELLSGIKRQEQFVRLRGELRTFPDVELGGADYERAAEMNNKCRSHGVSGNLTDYLICSVSSSRDWAIYTSDRDFDRYARHLDIKLYS